MRKKAVVILLCSLLAGCASVREYWHGAGWAEPTSHTPGPATKQPSAADAAPAKVQKKVAKPKGAPTATPDRTLFRRALLSLKPNRETVVSKRSRQLLNRLKKEYPSSPWSAEAAPLMDLIELADGLSRENRELKAANESLTHDVEELENNIEQMKRLDMELEKAR